MSVTQSEPTKAYLVAENGPDMGALYPLDVDEVTIGRHPNCQIPVKDSGKVSRTHAQIIRQGDGYFVKDLLSRNFTYLNDERLDDQLHSLRDGDRIRICDLEYRFRFPQPVKVTKGPSASTVTLPGSPGDESSFNRVLLEEDPVGESSSTVMAALDVVSGTDGSLQVTANLQARLNALMEITRALGRALALDDVLPKVLNSLFKIFLQADRGFIVLQAEDGTLVPRWARARRPGQEETIRISRTIVRRVMESKEAILSRDAAGDERLDMSQSVADLRIRSMMCAPLLDSEGNALGVLQVDTLDQRKHFQHDDLEVLIAVAIQAGIAVNNAQLHERALKQKEIEQDLELAKEVQKAFLPQKRPELAGYEFFDFYRPMIFVGGDYYDYITLPDGRTAVIVADVVGHGIAAAMMMAKVSAEAKFCLASESHPATAVTMLNSRLSAMQIDRFVTFVAVVLDPVQHEATIVNCGHMAPVWRRNGAVIEEPGEELSGLPLGIMDGVKYRQATIKLEAGDVLAMYTDGINEAMNPKGQQYSIERIRGHVRTGAARLQTIGETIVNEVLAHIGTGPQTDDMCLVLLQRN